MMIFKRIVSTILALPLFFYCMVAWSNDLTVSIRAEQWDMPRHGEALIKQADLGRIAQQWSQKPDSLIVLHYPGGEEGELWVQELMDWLVALGIPSTAMKSMPGSGAEDIINLELVLGKNKNE